MSAQTRRGQPTATRTAVCGWSAAAVAALVVTVLCGLALSAHALPVASRATAAAAAVDWRNGQRTTTGAAPAPAATAESESASISPEVAAALELEAEIAAAAAAGNNAQTAAASPTATTDTRTGGAAATGAATIDANGEVHTPVEHDVSEYVRWAAYVQRAASLLQQEAVVKARTHANERAAARARAGTRSGLRGDPDADDRVEGRPILNKPQIINHDELAYQPTTVGSPKPWDWHPGLEGFRPTGGYFMQDPGCDRLMRIWFDTCAFVDEADSVFHHQPETLFPLGAVDDQVTTAKYIGNLLKQDFESEPRSHSAKQNVGHFPNGEKHEVPDDGAPDEEAEKAASL